jgi:hypothetical protein
MTAPARFPNGVTNVASQKTFGQMPLLDPTKAHVYFNDFDHFTAADWTITTTEAGAGSATEALGDADGGVLVITNDAADNDADFFQKVGESFKFTAGKKLVFKARFKVSDATESDWVMGLQITDTTPLAVSDGVWFQSDDGDANVDFHVSASSTATDVTALTTLANDTYVELGFYYDGVSEVEYFVNDVKYGHTAVTNLPSTELTISFGIQNGEAVAKVMTVDYILVAKER